MPEGSSYTTFAQARTRGAILRSGAGQRGGPDWSFDVASKYPEELVPDKTATRRTRFSHVISGQNNMISHALSNRGHVIETCSAGPSFARVRSTRILFSHAWLLLRNAADDVPLMM